MKFQKIYIELSDICGLECSFCPSVKALRGVMSLDDFENLARKIHNKARLFTFHLLGDPLILENLEQYLNIARAYKMKLELTTSGFYLSKKNQALLLEFDNIRQINLSLMSFLSQKKLKFEAYFSPILELCDKHISLKKQSFINLRLWNLKPNFQSPLQNEPIYKLLEEHFKLKIDKEARQNRLARKIFLHQARLFKWASLNSKKIKTTGSCHALSKQLGVLSNGILVPCCLDSAGQINLGNIFENSLEELSLKPRFVKMKEGFKRGILLEELCQKCEFYKARNLSL
ncbi:radical SAM protein [Campylobacter sp. MIT 99-7217]|uniref:radical SAM/SPASM domain-containing protein n=1 Tax=Campylobacter sp. MIT 99-7217 TaxID=535091 RepID=UPI00115B71D1|nr:radical SAM/SPASM domain-containing protein [Campylobacter sp. MIT 99-7217]TQR32335.1 radical SAM protein [Campylobacter sp. MIT 99-7217]